MSDTSLIFTILGRDQSGPALKSASDRMNKMKVASVAAFAAVGGAVVSSVKKAANFDQSIRMAGAAADASGAQIKQMGDLALKMGSASQFGAQGAAEAMVELAKAGITPAQMAAGALKGTMDLAAAGGLELGAASTYTANALSAFNLKASDAGAVAIALAGGANASTASVESLGLGLAQVGPGARNAGLSLQDTVAVLSAFDQAGIKGSDAGTSLKTMLMRLAPTSKKAKDEMKSLGLSFVDAKGAFLPISQIAQQLQDKFKGMSQEQRVMAMTTIFGSDATRAATVLMNDGAKGLDKYIAATKDASAAQKMVDANTQGAAGAWKLFHSAIDGLQITLARRLLPTIATVTQKMAGAVNDVTNFASKFDGIDISGAGKKFVTQAKGWATDIIAGVRQGFDTGDWGPLGKSLGNGLSNALTQATGFGAKAAGWLLSEFGKVNWFGVGKQAVGFLIPFITGLTLGIINDGLPILLSTLAHHLGETLLAAVGVALMPEAMAGKLAASLARIPFAGKLIAWGFKAFRGFGKGILRVVGEVASGIGMGLLRGLERIFPRIEGKFTGLAGALPGRLRSIGPKMLYEAKFLALRAEEGLRALPGKLGALAGKAAEGFLVKLVAGFRKVDAFFGGVPGRVIGVFADAGSWLFDAGRQILVGLKNGLESMAAAPINAAKSVGGKIVSGVKGVFGIKSPSRVMMEVGKNIVEGLTSGVKSKQADALSAVKDLVQKMKDKLATIKDFAKAIRDSFIAAADLTNLTGDDSTNSLLIFGGGTGGFAGMLKNLQQKAADATAFASGITQLRKMGLNETSIRQLRDAGPDQGGLAVQQLLSGGAGGIGQVNSLVKQIIGTGEDFAGKEAKKKYGINPYKSQPVTVKTVHSKITIDFTNAGAENALVEAIRKAVRKKGGNVQLVLGK